MKKLVKKNELSQKSGLVAVSRTPFTDNEINKLTAKLSKFALVHDGSFYQIFGE
jgi:hypothetical protein